jgi:PAS domain S-box-containing protein
MKAKENNKNNLKVRNKIYLGYKILVVEDDKDLSQLICKKLQQEGFQTKSVLTGGEAIARLIEDPCTLLLLDYQLPDMTGPQVIRALAKRKCSVPFILMTAYGNEKLAVKMMKLGARDYLAKDKIFCDVLPTTVKQVINQLEAEKKLIEAEKALTLSKEKYRMLIDNMHDGIIVTDKRGIVKFVNPTTEAVLGRTKEELLGEMFAFAAPTHGMTEINIDRPDGSRRIAEMQVVESEWEGESAFFVSVSDITERKRTEEVLHRAHKETEQLLSSISSILIGVNDQGKITRWNKAAETTFGIDGRKVVGTPFVDCGIKWEWSEVLERISRCQNKDQPTHLDDIQYTRQDGREGFLSITVNPISGDTDKHGGYLLLATEITERKTLESQLTQAQKLESIGQLAAGIAHEINTPIQYVGDNIRFLQDAFDDLKNLINKYNDLVKATEQNTLNKERLAEIESIVRDIDMDYLLQEIPLAVLQSLEGVERVANIVRAMKEFSHPGVEEKTLTDINKALANTITVARNEWKYVAEIVKNFDPSLPLVPCLPGELNQVFLNIIVNSAHAIAAAVNEDCGDKGTITISTNYQREWVEIRISDTGTGIPEEIRSKIFDPFFTTKEVGKGTGQGLAIAHNVVVEKHGGMIFFETEMSKGTTFIIRLPLNQSDHLDNQVKSES